MKLIEKQKRTMSLDHYEGMTGAGTVAEAAELLYDILNASYACSRTCLSVEINGNEETVQSLYWKCKDLLERTSRYPEKTGFLAMSVLDQTWQSAKPLCLLPLDALMSEDGLEMIEKAKRLERILAEDEYKAIWKEKSAGYLGILDRMGFNTEGLDFSNLTDVMDPLLSALSFYNADTGRRAPDILKVRDGNASGAKSPAIATAMCMYSSEKEFADAVMGSGKEALVAFGAIEKTNRQIKNYFYEYLYGFPDERQRNFMRNDHLTAEEYLDSPCDYTRKVMLAVKDGRRLYLVHMPWKGDGYSRPGQKNSEYYYGTRASYAPYQIFYKELAAAPEGTTMLSVKKDGWLLSGLMDAQSKAWLPAFLEETVSYFFRGRDDVKYAPVLLPEEVTATGPADGGESYQIVPAWCGAPAVVSYAYQVPEPRDVFVDAAEKDEGSIEPFDASARKSDANATALWFADYFGISPKDLAGAPILPKDVGTEEEFVSYMDELVKKAYVKVICDRVAEVTAKRWEVRKWAVHRIMDRSHGIVQDALDGKFHGFQSVDVAGTPLFDKNGQPEKEYSRKAGKSVQQTLSIEIGETREDVNLFKCLGHKILWASPETASKPAVVMKLRPETPGQYAALLGVQEDALPEMLRMSDRIGKLVEHFSVWIPNSMTNRWTACGYGDRETPCIVVPCTAAVNICMNKKAWLAAQPPKAENAPGDGTGGAIKKEAR